VESYKKLKQAGKDFEIIFCSSDRDEDSFKEYFATMPWISLPFNDPRKKALSRHFDVSGKSFYNVMGKFKWSCVEFCLLC